MLGAPHHGRNPDRNVLVRTATGAVRLDTPHKRRVYHTIAPRALFPVQHAPHVSDWIPCTHRSACIADPARNVRNRQAKEGPRLATTSNRTDIGSETARPASAMAHTIDGAELRGAYIRANRVVADHRDQLNALNVFPVPDGDTGTNMTLTMRSAIDAVEKLTGHPLRADRVASSFAFGALMGARGNSGVILSQILRGFSTAIEGKPSLTGEDIARGFDGAAEAAYKAVLNPVEGTMLTVIADASKAAIASLDTSGSAIDVLLAAADGAEASLLRTPEHLEVLRKANVVDSGGQGVAYILRAIANHLSGDTSVIQIGAHQPVPDLAAIDADEPAHLEESGYCTNFIVTGATDDPGDLRVAFEPIGSSIVVVGDERALRVHLHTEHPDRALAIALEYGQIDAVSIQNMDIQIRDRHAESAEGSQATIHDGEITGTHAIVAVSNGPGFTQVLLSLGATSVVEVLGEAKPSTEEILRAVESAGSDDVIILPNSADTLASASIVTGLTDKRVEIVASESFVAGLQALSAVKHNATLAANAEAMTDALAGARHVEIARAAKDADLDGVAVREGDWVFIADGRVTHAATDLELVATAGFSGLDGVDQAEIATIFLGKDAAETFTSTVRAAIATAFQDIEIEEIDGGQAFYPYIVGFE
jgi:DAK2 domain fusion protein YloV